MEKNLDKSSSSNNICTKWSCMVPSHFVWQIGELKDSAERFMGLRLAAMGYEGLFPSHCGILAMLFSAGGKLRMKDIVERLGRTKSTVSELVNKLESHGLVKRGECTADGRVCYVSLTDKSRAFEKDLASIAAELNAALYKNFSAEERETAESLIARMKNNLAE
ncbi:MAG: MarR family winged helix-turn-helix transcriptional regulator [Spirochaetota bacterium]